MSEEDESDLWGDSYEESLNMSGRVYKDTKYCFSDALKGRDLDKCSFKKSEFESCDLMGSSWHGADFEDVSFEDCDLTDAAFTHITGNCLTLTRCNIDGLDLTGASISNIEMIQCHGKILANDAKFDGSNFEGCWLVESDLTKSDFSLGTFEKCDLSSVCFYEATLIQAGFRNCNLSECVMTGIKTSSDFSKRPQYIDCVISPIGMKDNTWLTELLAQNEKQKPAPSIIPKEAHLFCSDYTEFDTYELQ